MLDDNGDPLLDEPETPTEKLRRLRYEAEELEAQIQAEADEKAKSRQAAGIDSEESEYELIDDLPKRDDADKSKPPPNRRRRKKRHLDENGELSPAILLKQLKRLRGGLAELHISEDIPPNGDGREDTANESRAKELLQKLGNIRNLEENGTSRESQGVQSASKASGTSNLSQLDSRLDALEKYVGTNEADIDEVCLCFFSLRQSQDRILT